MTSTHSTKRRKPPVSHTVKPHERSGSKIKGYSRGSGTARKRSPIMRRASSQIRFKKQFSDSREQVSRNYPGEGPYKDVDEGIREPVIWFNEVANIHSTASCEGHKEDQKWDAYIFFKSPNVSKLFLLAEKQATPLSRDPSYQFHKHTKTFWEQRYPDEQYSTFIKELPNCYVEFAFSKPNSTKTPQEGTVRVRPKSGVSFDVIVKNGKLTTVPIKHLSLMPEFKLSGDNPTQKEWDEIRVGGFEWVANKLVRLGEVSK